MSSRHLETKASYDVKTEEDAGEEGLGLACPPNALLHDTLYSILVQ